MSENDNKSEILKVIAAALSVSEDNVDWMLFDNIISIETDLGRVGDDASPYERVDRGYHMIDLDAINKALVPLRVHALPILQGEHGLYATNRFWDEDFKGWHMRGDKLWIYHYLLIIPHVSDEPQKRG